MAPGFTTACHDCIDDSVLKFRVDEFLAEDIEPRQIEVVLLFVLSIGLAGDGTTVKPLEVCGHRIDALIREPDFTALTFRPFFFEGCLEELGALSQAGVVDEQRMFLFADDDGHWGAIQAAELLACNSMVAVGTVVLTSGFRLWVCMGRSVRPPC